MPSKYLPTKPAKVSFTITTEDQLGARFESVRKRASLARPAFLAAVLTAGLDAVEAELAAAEAAKP